MSSLPGIPHKNKQLKVTREPQTPKKLQNNIFPLSSPYSGKSPLSIPILLPVQYNNNKYSDGGLVSKKLSYNESLHSIGTVNDDIDEIDNNDNNNNNNNNNNKIELFDKDIGKKQIKIPLIGESVENMPFFSEEKSKKFLDSLKNLNKQTKILKKSNDTIYELNESLGAYLFGLFENAWCVNLSEHITSEKLEKINKIKNLQNEINELKGEIEIVKTNLILKEQRRKSTMPPPSIPRFSNIGTNRINIQKNKDRKPVNFLKRINEQINNTSENSNIKRRNFLKAGSRNETFQSRLKNKRNSVSLNHNNNISKNQFKNGLNLSYATKIQTLPNTDDSLSDISGSDTSEVQTLNSIKRSNDIPQFKRNRSNNNNKRNIYESWGVKHKKPFR